MLYYIYIIYIIYIIINVARKVLGDTDCDKHKWNAKNLKNHSCFFLGILSSHFLSQQQIPDSRVHLWYVSRMQANCF